MKMNISRHNILNVIVRAVVACFCTSAFGGTMNTQEYYTWGIDGDELNIPDGSIITEAVLTLHDITNWDNNLHMHIVDNPPLDFTANVDDGSGDFFQDFGGLLSGCSYDLVDEDLVITFSQINDENSWVWDIFDSPFNFQLADSSVVSYSSSLLELIDYAGNSTPFGIGFDPDGNSYSFQAMTLYLTVESHEGQSEQSLLTFTILGDPPLPGLTVPNVVGLSQASAQSAMTAAGLAVGNVTTAYSNAVPAGNVISQSPVSGTSVVIDSAVDLVISAGRPLSAILLAKCKAKAGKAAGKDSISFRGTMDITEADLKNADRIYISIVSDADGLVVYDKSFTINQDKVRKGKYSHRDKQKGVSLKLDSNKDKFSLRIKNADLTGLSSPLSLEIVIGSYNGAGSAGETIVNGPKKSIPIQLMSGYKDTLPSPLKIKTKNGTEAGKDSLAVKGGFSLMDEPSEITSMTLSLGDQLFNITDEAGTFTYKRNKNTSTITSVAYKTDKGVSPQISAKFDFVKCAYRVSIKKAELETTSGQTTFGVLIDMSLSDPDYNESVEVYLN